MLAIENLYILPKYHSNFQADGSELQHNLYPPKFSKNNLEFSVDKDMDAIGRVYIITLLFI